MKYKELDQDVVKKLREVEIELLDEIVRICKKHNLVYMLFYGTLLGAIRHSGFIPWDDDLDIAMPRDDYQKFIEISKKELGSKYYLACSEFNPKYHFPFMKIEKKDTLFQEDILLDMNISSGIYVDIVPLDNTDSLNKYNKYRSNMIRIINTVIYRKLGRKTKYSNEFIRFFLSKFSINFLKKKQYHLLTENHNNNSKYLTSYCGAYMFMKETIERDSLLPTSKVAFNGKEYDAPNNCDAYLKHVYGNYMELPPVEKRVNHCAREISFDTRKKGV